MSIHKTKDGRWYARYRDEFGKQKKIYTGRGPMARKEAQAIDLEIKLAKKRGLSTTPPAGMFLDELAAIYIQDREPVCSAGYINDLRSLLNNHVLPKCCHVPVDELTYRDIITAMEPFNSRSIATRNRYFSYLRAIFNWGIRHGLTKANPLGAWKKAKEPRRRVRLTVEDLKKIMAHAAL